MTANKSLVSAEDALYVAGGVGVLAKLLGVLIAPGARGVLGETAVTLLENGAAAFSYLLVGLLLVLIGGAALELSRAREVGIVPRAGIVALSGIVMSLAVPSVAGRLGSTPALALAILACLVALVGGATALRHRPTRALGGVLDLLALTGVLRVVAYETAAAGYDRGAIDLVDVARGLATAAVGLQALAGLLAAGWIGSRSRLRGRLLANLAIIAAFFATWLAARAEDTGSTLGLVLHTSLAQSAGAPPPFALGSLAAFLLPAFLFLAAVALVQPADRRSTVSLALLLLSHGSFDVPLQALLVTAGAAWTVLAIGPALPPWARSRSDAPAATAAAEADLPKADDAVAEAPLRD